MPSLEIFDPFNDVKKKKLKGIISTQKHFKKNMWESTVKLPTKNTHQKKKLPENR